MQLHLQIDICYSETLNPDSRLSRYESEEQRRRGKRRGEEVVDHRQNDETP